MTTDPLFRRKPRGLALALVEVLDDRIRDGRLAIGDKLPTETAIMGEFGVSRTVVREAISKLQASGLVQTRHGIGSFVLGLNDAPGFRISPTQVDTLRDVIAMLELRIGVETEAAVLAADFQFRLEVARASQNSHFAGLMASLGSMVIPPARLEAGVGPAGAPEQAHWQYPRRVNGEHASTCDAIANHGPDGARSAVRTHLANSRERRCRAQAGLDGDAAG